MLVPDTVAVPWLGADATATDVAVPVMARMTVLLLLLAATVALTLATVGGAALTVMLAVAALDVPPLLVAV